MGLGVVGVPFLHVRIVEALESALDPIEPFGTVALLLLGKFAERCECSSLSLVVEGFEPLRIAQMLAGLLHHRLADAVDQRPRRIGDAALGVCRVRGAIAFMAIVERPPAAVAGVGLPEDGSAEVTLQQDRLGAVDAGVLVLDRLGNGLVRHHDLETHGFDAFERRFHGIPDPPIGDSLADRALKDHRSESDDDRAQGRDHTHPQLPHFPFSLLLDAARSGIDSYGRAVAVSDDEIHAEATRKGDPIHNRSHEELLVEVRILLFGYLNDPGHDTAEGILPDHVSLSALHPTVPFR